MATYGIALNRDRGEYAVYVNSRRTATFSSCESALAFIDLDRELRAAGLAHPTPTPMAISPCPLVVAALAQDGTR